MSTTMSGATTSKDSAGSRIYALARYVGFGFCAASILLAMARVVGEPPVFLYVVVMGCAAGAITLGGMTRQPTSYWISCGAAIIVSYSPFLFAPYEFAKTACAVAAWVGTLLCLAAFRESIVPYLFWGVATGALFQYTRPEAGAGPFIAIAFLLVLALINYVYKLYLDHRKDFFEALKKTTVSGRLLALAKTTVLWLPAAGLAWAGLQINLLIQEQVKISAYATGYICLAPPASRSYYGPLGCAVPFPEASPSDDRSKEREWEVTSVAVIKRDARSDALFTLGVLQGRAEANFKARFESAIDASNGTLTALPSAVSTELEKTRPPPIDVHRACANSKTKKKGVKISMRGMCRDIIRSIEQTIVDAHTRASERIDQRVRQESAKANATIESVRDAVQAAGLADIRAAFAGFKTGTEQGFLALWFLTIVSYVMLVAGLVAAYQLILGRLLFDSDRRHAPVFRLDPGDQARSLQHKAYNELNLKDREDQQGPTRWYVALNASRHGVGSFMNLTIPGARRCLLQRLFAGKLLMTKIDMRKPKIRAASAATSPKISLAGDLKLVAIKVSVGQQIVFRMHDLIAHTSGVKLGSVYSTHVGAHLLGLGSFYAVASGKGDLVLQSEGEEVLDCETGNSHQGTSFLAWDRRHAFSLSQSTTFGGIWFNEPSLCCQSVTGAAIVDESKPNKAPLARRTWSLFRYLFMPF